MKSGWVLISIPFIQQCSNLVLFIQLEFFFFFYIYFHSKLFGPVRFIGVKAHLNTSVDKTIKPK